MLEEKEVNFKLDYLLEMANTAVKNEMVNKKCIQDISKYILLNFDSLEEKISEINKELQLLKSKKGE